MISLVQSLDHEGSPTSKEEKLRWEGFVEKVGFEAGVKKLRSDGWWECDDDRDGLRSERDESRQDWLGWWNESWSWFQRRGISEWAISDFQWGDSWWARKGDNRWGASTARGLKRDKAVEIARLIGCKNFVGKRKKFIFKAHVGFPSGRNTLCFKKKFTLLLFAITKSDVDRFQ